jgi:hypothetical protein
MTTKTDSRAASGFNRRNFIAVAAGSVAVPLTARAAGAAVDSISPVQDASLPVNVTLQVNGSSRSLTIDARTTVLDALREHIGLTGSKKGCDHGQRGVHRTDRWPSRAVVPDAGARRTGPADHDHRGIGGGRPVASDAAGVHRSGRVSVRLLHAWTDHVGGGLREGGPRLERRRNPRIYEREYLPLRSLSEHRGRGETGRRSDRVRRAERLD